MKRFSKMNLPGILLSLCIMLNLLSCDKKKSTTEPETGSQTGTVTDIDGNDYQTIKIGAQWWMAENLKVTHYRDGTSIPNVMDNDTWANLTTGAYCNYDNDENNVETYGRLYNWYVTGSLIAPEGWHVPDDGDWEELENALGGPEAAGGKLKEAGTEHWDNPNTNASNESGYTSLPGGFRSEDGFTHLGYWAMYWSSTQYNAELAGCRGQHADSKYCTRCTNNGDKNKGH
ncbi:MAG: fibrobacter succinogenes major paralogous domain-containing protein [candidate division KSB1 bacterium]|jgi:uncharacterized protein (TIGR02145 family)|nr:fibrobacter succinogenes major paralogous domain-containing protein [candidate division KSB1 bacterium]